MRTFQCPSCSAALFFDNDQCLSCGTLVVFDVLSDAFLADAQPSLRCANGVQFGICNWVKVSGAEWCSACGTNVEVPDLAVSGNLERWKQIEASKRRLIYDLHSLRVAHLIFPAGDSEGLRFVFNARTRDEGVVTGHDKGLVTLDIEEADRVTRLRRQLDMGERYRTVLGHMRHEVGHYYWMMLVENTDGHEIFRELFGDESADYTAALEAHYASQPEQDWASKYITHYASAHPHEDWAETFAHLLHIVDTLQTAQDQQLVNESGFASGEYDIESLLGVWRKFSVQLNMLSRSMGYDDFYPFVLSPLVEEKLRFVHSRIAAFRYS